MAKIFDGTMKAREEMTRLKGLVAEKRARGEILPRVVTFCVRDDSGSVLYTHEKIRAARELGIGFEVEEVSFAMGEKELLARVKKVSGEKKITGIMIQKPMKKSYDDYFLSLNKMPEYQFGEWWEKLRMMIPVAKDIDCLSPVTAKKIIAGEAGMLPATVKAVLKIVTKEKLMEGTRQEVLIIGRTDLLGVPLYHFWRRRGVKVSLVGRQGLSELLQSPHQLSKFTLIVSATGVADLIKGEMVGEGVALIDVGWPKGDFDFVSCVKKASFITPVPRGVGPLTVVSLLENALEILP